MPDDSIMPDDPIPPDEWQTVVANVPITSVDLVVRTDGGVVLGKRTNEPAKGEWFVPGGTVFKMETLEDAVHRVAREELGTDVAVERSLGAFEHCYETADVPGVESKHYVAHAYVVTPTGSVSAADDQHADLRIARPPIEDCHPYVERYLDEVSFDA